MAKKKYYVIKNKNNATNYYKTHGKLVHLKYYNHLRNDMGFTNLGGLNTYTRVVIKHLRGTRYYLLNTLLTSLRCLRT